MLAAPIPQNEQLRVKHLQSLGLLDTQAEERFDRITRLAQQLLDVPIAVISLIDTHRQWFKSAQGLTATQTQRSISFCGHAICHEDSFIVEDTLNDERFYDNPLVLGDPKIRFYAAQNIKTPEGICIGTLAIMDTKPRELDADERNKLSDLARWVELEVAKPSMETMHAKQATKTVLSFVPNAFLLTLSKKLTAICISSLVAMILMTGSYTWYQQEQAGKTLNNTNRATELLSNIRGKIETELNSRLFLTKGLAGLVRAKPDLSEREFQEFAKSLGETSSAIRSLQLAPKGIVKHVWPLETNQAAIGHDLLKDPTRRNAAEKALLKRNIWIAGPLNLIQGGQALIGRLPIYLRSEKSDTEFFWGFATILIDVPAFLKQVGLDSDTLKSFIAIRGTDSSGSKGRIFYGDASTIENAVATATVSLPAGKWDISIRHLPSLHGTQSNLLFWFVSALICLFVPLLIYILLRLPKRFQLAVEDAKVALEQSEIRFRDAIDALPDGFVIFDKNDRLITCNDRYRKLYELSRDYLQEGRSFEEIIRYAFSKGQFTVAEPQDTKAQDTEALIKQRIERHHQADSPAMEERLASGQWVRVVERPIRAGGSVGFLVDITQLKENEIELAKSRDKAESANQAKSVFLATMSHEVRTPMNVILGLLEVLNDNHALPAEQKRYLDTAYNSAQQLLHLLNEILDISKMEANKLQLDKVNFNIETAIENVLTLTETSAKDKNLKLIKQVHHLPRSMVCGDQMRLKQILINLISNAIKFTESGQVKIEVSTTTISEQEVLLDFAISDTGVGFSDEQSDLLFKPFSQLDNSARRKHEGSGLGLAICKQLVELMGGEITAHGKPGKGATFNFNIPFMLSDHAIVPASKGQKKPKESISVVTQTFDILLAEDSPSNQIVFQAMLNASPFKLHIVNDGKAAVNALQTKSFDAVLMDIYMPEMDGVTATEKVRADGHIPYTPIIALTANAMQGDQDRFIAAGMDDYLAKPVDKQRLINTLEKWTTGKNASRG